MEFSSTRGGPAVGLGEAVEAGLALDGGLYVPSEIPSGLTPAETLPETAVRFLTPYFEGDPLADHLPAIAGEALDLTLPLVPLGSEDHRLELFWGPTAAFKDFGARFLAACLSRRSHRARTVLVATSGDTGAAVGAAFAGRPGVRVLILYPEGRISPRQETQLCGFGPDVTALAVRGDFDDCQRIAKEAFADEDLREKLGLTSANSINLGRLLPQAAYVIHAAGMHLRRTGKPLCPIIPTGNLGHGFAALWARAAGAPVDEVVFALNANRPVLELIETGKTHPRPTVATVANAMDVGHPSNAERLLHFFPDPRGVARAFSFGDDEIRAAIRAAPARWGFVPCPHTACALLARESLGTSGWTVFATAHPAKFETIVEPLIGASVPPPPALAAALERPWRRRPVDPALSAVLEAFRA